MIAVLFLIATLAIGLEAACPHGFVAIDGSCFFVSHNKATWGEASAICQSFHGELATIKDRQELTSLATLMRRAHGDKFWIDATDIIFEGDWEWNSINTPIDFSMLGVSVHDNDKGKNCLYIDQDSHGQWKAEGCDEEYYYLCQHFPTGGGAGVVG